MSDLNLPSVPTTSFVLEYDRAFNGSKVSTAVAELPDGATIRLRIADHIGYIAELESVNRELTLLAHPTTNIQRLSDVAPRVEQPDIWYTQWSADFYGRITQLDVEPIHSNEMLFDVLDVGVGSIYLHPLLRKHLPEAEAEIRVGDALYVPASVIEVWDVFP